ncbi:MAG: phenylacetate--CoA ligase [Proteobacteria bacterium]|nr:phenylacetate--CoA ligase [Pseudomonadota bacterium]
MSDYFDPLETRAPADREAALFEALKQQVAHAKSNAPAYADSLRDLDLATIDSKRAFAQIPLTRKSDLISRQKAIRPFGGLTALNTDDLRYVFASPGPIYEPGTERPDYWRMARAAYAAGFRKQDLIHSAFSYHLTPAGAMVDTAAHKIGCAVIPGGVGQTDLQLQTIADLKPDGYIGTPSFLRIIVEKALEKGIDVSSIKKALVSGEAFPPSTREFLAEQGVFALQCYATADLGLIAYESSADSGLIIDEGVYLEIVRPGSGDPVPDGEVGEVVVTTFNPDYPLIRFATGDLSAIQSGMSTCGRTNRRIKGWMGRADQTAKIRGMFVHPEQVSAVVHSFPEISKARLTVDWIDEKDQMFLKCEVDDEKDGLGQRIGDILREKCKLRGEVELVSIGSLPNDGLIIEDIRTYE